jgi:hypothetical protein
VIEVGVVRREAGFYELKITKKGRGRLRSVDKRIAEWLGFEFEIGGCLASRRS